jgi:hypothetical protein
MSRERRRPMPVALLIPPAPPPPEDGPGAVPQHPVAAAVDRGLLEVVELDDRIAPVGMLPTDPAWMRLLESLVSYPCRWWHIISGIAVLVLVAAIAVVGIGTLVPGGRLVAGGMSVIASGATTGGIALYRRRRRLAARRSRHGKGSR